MNKEDELQELKNEIAEIKQAAHSSREELFDKCLNVVQWYLKVFAGIIAVSAAVMTIFGFLGLGQLKVFYKEYLKNEIESWLTLSDSSSETFKTLDELRTELLITRKTFFSGSNATLNRIEKERLINVLMDPSTTDRDFVLVLDILNDDLLFLFPSKESAALLNSVLLEDKFSEYKKLQLLSMFRSNRFLVELSKKVLNDKQSELDLKLIAFDNLAQNDPNYLLKYSSENINKIKLNYGIEKMLANYELNLFTKMALFLAVNDPESIELEKFIDKVLSNKKNPHLNSWEHIIVKILLARFESLTEQSELTPYAQLINQLIKSEYKINPTDYWGMKMA